MDKGLLISFTETTEEFDAELREWFIHEHVDERALYTNGFLGAKIYKTNSDGPKYFATYETINYQILRSDGYINKVKNQSQWSKRIIPKLTLLDRMTAIVTINCTRGFARNAVTIRFFPEQNKKSQETARTLLKNIIFPQILNYTETVGLLLAENMTDISNSTGDEARSFGGSPKVANLTEWIIIIEGHKEKKLLEIAKNTFSNKFIEDIKINKLPIINSYDLLYGNYRKN